MAQKQNTPEHQLTMLEIILNYLKTTTPALLFMHVIYMLLICATLSFSYIITFHWSTVVQIYTEAHNIKGFGQNLKVSVESDIKLNDILDKIRDQTGAIRSYIYRYHNGLAAINGVPFFFQTNTHESIAPGATRLLPYEQRMPASFNIGQNTQFVKNACIVVLDADSDKEHQNYYAYQSRGARAFIRCPIYLDHGDLFGFVGLDFDKPPVDSKKALGIIHDAADDISNIFETLKK